MSTPMIIVFIIVGGLLTYIFQLDCDVTDRHFVFNIIKIASAAIVLLCVYDWMHYTSDKKNKRTIKVKELLDHHIRNIIMRIRYRIRKVKVAIKLLIMVELVLISTKLIHK